MAICLPKITFCFLMCCMILMDEAAPTSGQPINSEDSSVENYYVLPGGTQTLIVNISDENEQAHHFYFGRGSPLNPIIKFAKGDGGNGTCFAEWPGCKENYGLRQCSEEKTLKIMIRKANKSMEGWYRLFAYCVGTNHNCNTGQPMESFILNIRDANWKATFPELLGATPTSGQPINLKDSSVENYNVPPGGTLTLTVNISDKNEQAYHFYLGRGSPLNPIIKFAKGDCGNGTCFAEWPKCKENYGLRQCSEEKTLIIVIREANKSMVDWYRLFAYCVGTNHNCNTGQPMESFILNIEDELEPTKMTTVDTNTTGSGPTTEPLSSGGQNPTQETPGQGPVSKGTTNHALNVWTISTAIIVFLIRFVYWNCHSSCRGKGSGTTINATEIN